MRSLASFQHIEEVKIHPNADALELVRVLGWWCVAKKGEFNPGDGVVYLEIDSLLPDIPYFEFMRARKFRVKTIRLRGELSQGLVIPAKHVPEIMSQLNSTANVPFSIFLPGFDFTEFLGVTKYEPPEVSQGGFGFQSGRSKGNFPSFISKTDETRIQSIPRILYELNGRKLTGTLKLDGTSCTVFKHDNTFGVCSRNFEIARPEGTFQSVYWNMALKYELEDRLPDGWTIQGEIVGPGIQKNRLKLPEVDFFVFNVVNTYTGERLDYAGIGEFLNQHIPALKPVPEVLVPEWLNTVQDFLDFVDPIDYDSGHPAEGVVFRTDGYSEALRGPFSFKAISNRFLDKTGE